MAVGRETKKSLIEKLHMIWNDGDLSLIPEVYAEEFVVHWPRSATVPECHGQAGVQRVIEKTRAAFPDWYEDVVDMIIDGDRVVTRYISTGTFENDYEGIPANGGQIRIDEISIFRVQDGRVAEQWCLEDDLTFLKQMGAG